MSWVEKQKCFHMVWPIFGMRLPSEASDQPQPAIAAHGYMLAGCGSQAANYSQPKRDAIGR